MLRIFLRLVSPNVSQPQKLDAAARADRSAQTPHASSCHRDRLLSMRLAHTRLCSEHRCDLLGELGIVTAGDLLSFNVAKLKHPDVSPKAARLVRRYRGAIRLAVAVPGMMPRDAQLLIGVHRRSVRGLACESPAALHRDLVRFSLSTKGRRLVRGRRLPSVRRIRKWIEACGTTLGDKQVLPRVGDTGLPATAHAVVMPKAA